MYKEIGFARELFNCETLHGFIVKEENSLVVSYSIEKVAYKFISKGRDKLLI